MTSRSIDEGRLQDAVAYLREAVFRSRARQAASSALQGAELERPAAGPADCGLGKEAAVELDLSEEGARRFRRLWPQAPPAATLERVRALTEEWVVLQDALDRKRNHFLRDFRQEHGFDRRAYAPEVADAYEAGLQRVNERIREKLLEHARLLAELA